MTLKLNRSQALFLDLLADNRPHSKPEFRRLLDGEFTEDNTIYQHMFQLKGKLRPIGYDIICFESFGTTYYQKIVKIA